MIFTLFESHYAYWLELTKPNVMIVKIKILNRQIITMQFTVLYKLVVNVVMPAGLFEQFNNIHLALSSLPQYYNDLFQLGLHVFHYRGII